MATEKRKHGAVHDDPDQRYFQTHLSRLVRERGGEWIVLAEGNLVGIGNKQRVPGLIQKARSKYPHATPFAAPIPTKEDVECAL